MRTPEKICLPDRLETPRRWGVMPLTVGRAQVMADRSTGRKAVAAQYAWHGFDSLGSDPSEYAYRTATLPARGGAGV